MATLWIREYTQAPVVGGSSARGSVGGAQAAIVNVAQEPGTDQTAVTFSTSAQSAAFGASTRYIGMIANADFHYVVAASPTATTNALMVPADTLVFIGVTPGHKVAAIAAA